MISDNNLDIEALKERILKESFTFHDDVCPRCGRRIFHNMIYCDKCGEKRGSKTLTLREWIYPMFRDVRPVRSAITSVLIKVGYQAEEADKLSWILYREFREEIRQGKKEF